MAPATVFDEETGTGAYHANRNNSFLVLGISEMDVLTEIIRHRIAAATRIPTVVFELPQVLHYAVGQQFASHFDFLEPATVAYRDDLARFGQRVATFLIYLNDDYAGGETSFPEIGLKFRGQQGDALLFANVTADGSPDPKTLHAGMPPISGENWVFSQWIRN